MKYIIFCILICILPDSTTAQDTDTLTSHITASASGSANQTNDGTTYLFNNLAGFDMKKNDVELESRAAWIYGRSPEKLTNNDFTGGLDINLHKTFPNFYYWGLANYKTSLSLNIVGQLQTGVGVVYQFINKENIKLDVSNGILFESSSIIDDNDSNVVYQTFRNSLRLQFRYTVKDKLTFSTVSFWQPSLQYGNDYIITNNTGLEFKIWKYFSFTSRVLYNHISRTDKQNLLFTYGIKADYKF